MMLTLWCFDFEQKSTGLVRHIVHHLPRHRPTLRQIDHLPQVQLLACRHLSPYLTLTSLFKHSWPTPTGTHLPAPFLVSILAPIHRRQATSRPTLDPIRQTCPRFCPTHIQRLLLHTCELATRHSARYPSNRAQWSHSLPTRSSNQSTRPPLRRPPPPMLLHSMRR